MAVAPLTAAAALDWVPDELPVRLAADELVSAEADELVTAEADELVTAEADVLVRADVAEVVTADAEVLGVAVVLLVTAAVEAVDAAVAVAGLAEEVAAAEVVTDVVALAPQPESKRARASAGIATCRGRGREMAYTIWHPFLMSRAAQRARTSPSMPLSLCSGNGRRSQKCKAVSRWRALPSPLPGRAADPPPQQRLAFLSG
jgi:hypothetical protein